MSRREVEDVITKTILVIILIAAVAGLVYLAVHGSVHDTGGG